MKQALAPPYRRGHHARPLPAVGLLTVLVLTLATTLATSLATASDATTSAAGTAGSTATSDTTTRHDPTPFRLDAKPVWEAGIGAGYFEGFDYPASLDTNTASIALPFFIYRGPRFRLGGSGVSAIALEQPRLKVDLSLAGSLSSSSAGNRARAGMPDLDYLFEVGPQVALRLADRPLAWGRWQLTASARLRAVFSTDFRGADSRGAVALVGVAAGLRNIRGSALSAGLSLSSIVASEALHAYFYDVPTTYATASRPAYDADGGYLGSTAALVLAWRFNDRMRLFGLVRTSLQHGSANEDSPLFETRRNDSLALGFAWTVLQSRNRVSILDTEGN